MVIECLEIYMPLYNKEKYIKITAIIVAHIAHIINNYNKVLPIKVHIDAEKIRKIIEKVRLNSNDGKS